MTEILREICGTGIVMQPSENDLATPQLRPVAGAVHARQRRRCRVQVAALPLCALPGDVVSFGMRQDIYEYWHVPATRAAIGSTSCAPTINPTLRERIKDMCSRPLPHGEVP